MSIRRLFASWFMALSLLLLARLGLAEDAVPDLSQRICVNLATEAQRILDDTSPTSKYLSPYIAAEIYQQVVQKTVAGADVPEPAMAALPCGDTVAAYLMAIKKRMEYNRIDHFIVGNRVLIYCCVVLLLVAGFVYSRYRRHLARQTDTQEIR
jgi:hypothetical protein